MHHHPFVQWSCEALQGVLVSLQVKMLGSMEQWVKTALEQEAWMGRNKGIWGAIWLKYNLGSREQTGHFTTELGAW